MALNLFDMSKSAIRKIIPKDANTVLTRLDDFGIKTGFGTNLPIKDPQRSYMWEVRFSDSEGNGEYITHYAKTTAIPPSITESIKRWYAGSEYSYSGRDTSPRIFRVTFWDNQNLDTYRFFQYWFDIMNQGVDNKKANVNNYLRKIQLVLLDSSDSQELFTIYMTDAYPTEISEVALSYSESGDFTFDVMFSYRKKVIR